MVMRGHMIKYHVFIPLCVFAVALVVGAPFGTAFVVGMMSGCVSMMVMMMAMGGHARVQQRADEGTTAAKASDR